MGEAETRNAPFTRAVVGSPSDHGIDEDALTDLVARAQREIDEGRLPSAQIAFTARDGKVAVSITLGVAEPESRYVIFSSTKPIVASALWILMGEGALDVTRRVVELVPEFGTNGKDVITIEQVMLHTSGFPAAPFSPLDWDERERWLARFSQWRCNWEPGTRYVYHPSSAHWVLAEVIERVTGADFRDLVRTRVIDPLGLSSLQVGGSVVPPDLNRLVATGSPASPDELDAVLGIRELPLTEVTIPALLSYNRPEVQVVGVPGAGGISTAADVALFYQALLHDPLDMWKPEVLADVKSTVRNSLPDFMGTPANRTRGLIVKGDDEHAHMRGMGRVVGPRTIGHNGAGGQIAWGDPDTGVSFCFLTNGLDEHQMREWRRGAALANRAGACVR